jgi:hypothetical protein
MLSVSHKGIQFFQELLDFSYGVFNDVSNPGYTVTIANVTNKCWILKNVEGSGHGLFQGPIPKIAWRKASR